MVLIAKLLIILTLLTMAFGAPAVTGSLDDTFKDLPSTGPKSAYKPNQEDDESAIGYDVTKNLPSELAVLVHEVCEPVSGGFVGEIERIVRGPACLAIMAYHEIKKSV